MVAGVVGDKVALSVGGPVVIVVVVVVCGDTIWFAVVVVCLSRAVAG